LPRRATRPGIIGLVPESNPAYVTAELGTLVVFMNQVVQIMVPSVVSGLGSGMTFGPAPDFSGQWTWLNIQHLETNPLNESGFFFSRYEYFVKALEYAQDAMVILYRRCMQVKRTGCEIETDPDAVATGAVAVTVDAVAGDFSAANNTVALTLASILSAKMGDAVTITHGGGATPGIIVGDSNAPVYVIGWATGADNKPTVYTQFTTSSTITVS